MPLEDDIADYLRRSPQSKARDIAAALRTDRSQVNSLLYRAINVRFRVDSDYRWSLVQNSNGEVLIRPAAQSFSEISEPLDDATVLRSPHAGTSQTRGTARRHN